MRIRRRSRFVRVVIAVRRFQRIRLRLSIPLRLALGFVLAALLAATATGVVDFQRLSVLHAQALFYQTLLQTTATLTTENDTLKSINIQTGTMLAEASVPHVENEALVRDEHMLEALLQQYHQSLLTFLTHDLLAQHPDQVSLLSNGSVQVEQQRTYASGAWRTWSLYEQTERQMLQDVKLKRVGDAQALAHLQEETEFEDALSALHSLFQFNEQLANVVESATGDPVTQFATLLFGVLLVFLAVLLIGFVISRTLIVRLASLHRVTQAIRRGQMDARVPVQGHDEITDVSRSVNTMLDALVTALQKETIAKEQTDLAYARQRQLTEMKDQFIRHMSHELRTPLTGVYGFLQLLHHYQDTDPAQQQLFVTLAMKGCEELIALCTSILDASNHADLRAPQRVPIVLTELIEELLAQQRPQEREEHSVVLTIPPMLTVQADPLYVRQVLRNLLSNSYKYTHANQPIFLETFSPETGAGDEDKALVGICVRDTGPGIPPEEQGLLFQPFVRLKRDLTGPIRGTGLGLSLCKQFVEAMGGRIWVESSGIAGEGSRFCFTLPQASIPVNSSDPTPCSGQVLELSTGCTA